MAELIASAWRGKKWPPPLARSTGDNRKLIEAITNLSLSHDQWESEVNRARLTLGSLVIGEAAETAFEKIYASEMKTSEVQLVDDRSSRSDSDYLLLNGSGRPLYRINIKLHGSSFRMAKSQVGLAPEDCFPLATYKIALALQKQDQQHLPFLFVVANASGLTAEAVGTEMPPAFVSALTAARQIFRGRKREFEEALVRLLRERAPDLFSRIEANLQTARWHVFSARRAYELMKEHLFDRVFALRQRGFNRAFRNAEIDMHLSFSNDMMTVEEFLRETREQSLSVVGSKIERGTI